MHSRPLSDDDPDIAPDLVPLRGALMKMVRRPVNIQASRDVVIPRTIQTIADAGYVDAFRACHPREAGFTMPSWDPHVRLDYVFVPSAFRDRSAAANVVRDGEVVSASDHLPVVADLTIP